MHVRHARRCLWPKRTQRKRRAPTLGGSTVSGPQRQRAVTTAGDSGQQRATAAEGSTVSKPQHQRVETTACDSGQQHPRVAPSASHNVEHRYVSGPQRQSGATSASRNVRAARCQRAAKSEWRAGSEPQCQSGAPSAGRNVRVARRQRAATSELQRCYVRVPKRQCGAKLVYTVVDEEQDRSRETTVPGTDSSKYK